MNVTTMDVSESRDRVSARVMRHPLIDRLYHWIMAITVGALFYTAFWPTVFEGRTVVMSDLHWIAGVILVLLLVFHIARGLVWRRLRRMAPNPRDIPLPGRRTKPGKYTLPQKLFHLGVAVLLLGVTGSGCVMLFKIGTPTSIPVQLIPKNPYIVAQPTWDLLYALHGVAGAAMVAMVIIHVYFALRPDEWHLTRSMIRGWISREEYLAHYDPKRWDASERS